MHAWFSYWLYENSGCCTYLDLKGKLRAVCFVCEDKERGERYLREQMSHITDWVYLGQMKRFISESPAAGVMKCKPFKSLSLSPAAK